MEFKASPNFGERKNGATKPIMIILHYTEMPEQASIDRLCDPEAEVSAHYVVCEDGRIVQLVEEDKRAWHAGVSQWGEITDVNSYSIGIEIVNLGDHPYPQTQIDAVKSLCRDIMQRWDIKPGMVLGHNDISPGRKIDPGPHFPWDQFEEDGMAKRPPEKE